MKVKVTMTVDIDAEAWTLNYGTPREAIREDVRAYVLDLTRSQLGTEGADVLAEGGVR